MTPGSDKVFYAIVLFGLVLFVLCCVVVVIVRALARPYKRGRR